MKLLSIDADSRTARAMRTELVAFAVEAEREDMTPAKRARRMKEIISNHMGADSDEDALNAAAKDAVSNLKLSEKYLA